MMANRQRITMKVLRHCVLLVLFCVFRPAQAQNTESLQQEIKGHMKNLPFAMPELTVQTFPDHRVSISDCGAVADGITLNTKAFDVAVQECAKAGGGSVIVPPGTWLTGPIRLQSNIELHLERGALVQFSSRIEDFPIVAGLDGKSKDFVRLPPISGQKLNHIAITGEGIFDGAGEFWRPVKMEKLTSRQWKELIASGGVVSPDGKTWWPSKEARDGEEYIRSLKESGGHAAAEDYAKAREYLRPDLVHFEKCTGIFLDGVTFENSPRFHVHPVQSENIVVRNLKILAPWYAQNGDGLDLSSCRNVVVYNTTVDAGDDGICIKAGSISKSQKPGPACENIVIDDCTVYHAHGGFVVGSESYGGASNISVRNCMFIGTDVGVRFKSVRGKGGVVENIYIDGIQMRAIANEAILFDMYYGGDSPEIEAEKNRGESHAEPVTERTPQFRNISLKNIVCNGARRAVLLNGLPEMPVKDIRMENVDISAQTGVLCIDVDGFDLGHSAIYATAGPVISVNQCKNLNLSQIKYLKGADSFLRVDGDKTENIKVAGVDLSLAKKKIDFGKSADSKAVVIDEDKK